MNRNPNSTIARFVGTLLLVASSATALAEEPLRLDDRMLDRIDAGYLSVRAEAFAEALGDTTIAVTNVETDVSPHRSTRRYDYTMGQASAYALAAGDSVRTDVDAFYDTDEEVVRKRMRVRQKSRGNAAAVARRLGMHVPEGTRFERLEVQKLTFTIVTRTARQ